MLTRIAFATVAVLMLGSALFAGSIEGTIHCTGARSNADAVVFVEAIEGKTFSPSKEPAVMDQNGKEFLPKVLPVLVGTRVDFLNSDPFDHNVLTPDKCAGKFNLGAWPMGEMRSYTFNQPCNAVLLCNVHPEMAGYVIAVETPYFAVTNGDGRYSIPGVPDGAYTVSVWHERFKEHSETVTVNGVTTVNFTLKR